MRTIRSWCVAAVTAALTAVAVAAGEDLDPPLVGMHEVKDGLGVVALTVPDRWFDEGPDPADIGLLARFGVKIQPDKPANPPDVMIFVRTVPGYTRAALALRMTTPYMPGVLDPDSERTGDGWIEVRRRDDKGFRFTVRLIEQGGQVFEVVATTNEGLYDYVAKHIDVLLGGFKALQRDARFIPPKPLVATVVEGRQLWTDSKDKKLVKRVLDAHGLGWKTAAQILGGKLSWNEPASIVLAEDPDVYTKLCRGQPMTAPFMERLSWSVVCTTKQAADAKNADVLTRLAADQYVRQLFGGPTPAFIGNGLVQYAYVATALKGKPEKLPTSEVSKLRAAAEERDTKMPELWDINWEKVAEDDKQAASYDLWAWHLFFRHSPDAKPWAETYRASLDALSRTGDPLLARKEWESVDGAALKKAFRTWIAAWKP